MEARIRFFSIEQFGYYIRGGQNAGFGGTNESLEALSSWARDGREVFNTTTYEEDHSKDVYQTFFVDWSRDERSGDSVLVLWNETHNDDGKVYGIEPNRVPGRVEMLEGGFGAGVAIPGFPSYFWFIPDRNVYATIVFKHSGQGKSNLERYISGFIRNHSPFAVLDDESSIIGYSSNGQKTEQSNNTYSKFHSKGLKNPDVQNELFANIEGINRFLRKETLTYSVAENRNIIERMMSRVLGEDGFNQAVATFHQEISFHPTESQILNALQCANSDGLEGGQIGFGLKDGRKIWIDGVTVSLEEDLNISRSENEIVDARLLLNYMLHQRIRLLRYLPGS